MTDANTAAPESRRPVSLLALGAFVGIALAVASLLSRGDADRLPEAAVARVNGVVIRTAQFERAVAAMASDRRTPLTAADRQHILDRLVDEELLVQYGLSLGLAERDRRVRSDLVSAVLAAQVASVDGVAPSEAEVHAFYRDNQDFFRAPGRLRVRSLWIRAEPARTTEAARDRAEDARARLRAGEAWEGVAESLGDLPVAPVPDVMLPPVKLREYIGPTALRVVDGLAIGEVSEPIASEGAVRIFQLVDRRSSSTPALAEVRSEVDSEMKRRAGDRAVRQLLERLRENADLAMAAPGE